MKGLAIFLVEDEALIRMTIVEMLDELGHRVVAEAGSILAAVLPKPFLIGSFADMINSALNEAKPVSP
jgi:hypothetical protein